LFDAKDYGQAKAAYQQALAMKSAEAFPRQRLAEIDRIMQEQQRQAAQQQQIDQQYAQAVRDADNLFNASRLPEAKLAYQKASNIKLSETYPQQQIAKIDKVLGEQLRREQEQQALEQQYTNAVAQGDRAFSADQLTDARAAYQEALRIKSAEAYPKAQLAKIDQKLALAEKERQEKAAFEQKYTSMIASADRAYNSRDYKSAKDAYMAALDMKPGERYPQQQLNKIADFERILAAEQANAKVTAVNTGSSSGSQNTKPNPGALSDLKFANDSERDKYLNNLKGQYPEGVTLEVHKGRTATTYRYVVIRGNEVSEFRKVKYNYGDVEYSDNGIPTTGQYFESQVRTRAGEFYQEFNY
ncbi:MAG: hypothetical protein JW801_12360, partial [Bacteroidales bacterium]|nr:hypothetical protein [Bacteroidales bacterium]